MQAFADLLERLTLTRSDAAKVTHLAAYFGERSHADRGWVLALLINAVNLKCLKIADIQAVAEARMDPVLFEMSYDYVGNMADTVSLIWPRQTGANRSPPLEDIIEALKDASQADRLRLFESWMSALDTAGRWALIKLLTGTLSTGVSTRLARAALSQYACVQSAEIEEIWHGLQPPYADLFAWLDGNANKPKIKTPARFYPVMQALDMPASMQITADEFAAEWQWTGIRVQAVREQGVRRLFTQTGDDISHAFPDILTELAFDSVIDGVVCLRQSDGSMAPPGDVQKRLARKSISKKSLASQPAFFRAFDLLASNGEDLRALPYRERRQRLDALIGSHATDRIALSELVPFASTSDANERRSNPLKPQATGIILKRWNSPYLSGHPNGDWLKWTREPFLIKAVLLYAQRANGKRSGPFTEFTVGVWKDSASTEELIPIGKSDAPLPDDDLQRLNAFIRDNTLERFGPVHSVLATQETAIVFEIAFSGASLSTRHKSGITLQSASVNCIFWDKPIGEITDLESVKLLLPLQV